MELGTGTPLSIAAMRAGMSEPTARRYRTDPLPSPRTVPRAYRTRRDPFAALWPEIEALLVQALDVGHKKPPGCHMDNPEAMRFRVSQ